MEWIRLILAFVHYWTAGSENTAFCEDFTTESGRIESAELGMDGNLRFKLFCTERSLAKKTYVMNKFEVCPSDASEVLQDRLYRWVERMCDSSMRKKLNDFANKCILKGPNGEPIALSADALSYACKSTMYQRGLWDRELVSIEPQEDVFVLIHERENLYVFENVHSLLERSEVVQNMRVRCIPINFDAVLAQSHQVLSVRTDKMIVSFRLRYDLILVQLRPLTPEEEDKATVTCSICLEEIRPVKTTTVAPLTCGHWFHRQCISEWFKKQQTCPNCVQKSTIFDRV